MLITKPDFKIGQRAVPAEYLNNESKDKAGYMNDLEYFSVHARESPKQKKQYPQ